ncbi:hypothetical protein DVH24_020199 [Malus domestica]|uniref:Uncharacterized protein n=1 Tax=Malus domestica TaxID=3750 RepID=A0A498J7M8_MALDO|nr:hypothetical protein DVH24_020199 [Malus domestica]
MFTGKGELRVWSAAPGCSTSRGVDYVRCTVTSITETNATVRAALIERSSYEENYGGGERRVPEPARTISSSAFPSMDSLASPSISSLTLFTIS